MMMCVPVSTHMHRHTLTHTPVGSNMASQSRISGCAVLHLCIHVQCIGVLNALMFPAQLKRVEVPTCRSNLEQQNCFRFYLLNLKIKFTFFDASGVTN